MGLRGYIRPRYLGSHTEQLPLVGIHGSRLFRFKAHLAVEYPDVANGAAE